MRELWFTAFVLLLLGIVAGMAGLKQPTGAFAGNLPPEWNLPTNEFTGEAHLDLTQAFFDPDGDKLTFTAETLQGNTIHITQSGKYKITASDGKTITEQEIVIY